MSKSCWIDAGTDDDQAKLARNGVTIPVFDGRWLAAKPKPLEYLQGARARNGGAGVFLCSQGTDHLGTWPSHLTTLPEAWADWAYDMVQKKIAPGTTTGFPIVHLNNETDDVAWLLAMLGRFRAHSPRRVTLWSPAAHKANVFAKVGAKLAALNVLIGPQCYVGAKNQRVESANEVQAWAAIGIPVERICVFLDATQLGGWWGEAGAGAVAFTQGGLP